MKEIDITEKNFEEMVLKAKKTVLLDFWADWCGPCRMLAPVLAEIAEERNDVIVGKINVDEQPQLADIFRVSSIPSLFVLKNGKVVNSTMGFQSKKEVLSLL